MRILNAVEEDDERRRRVELTQQGVEVGVVASGTVGDDTLVHGAFGGAIEGGAVEDIEGYLALARELVDLVHSLAATAASDEQASHAAARPQRFQNRLAAEDELV